MENVPQAGPDLAVLSTEHTKGALGGILDRNYCSIFNDGLQVERDIFLRHDEIGVVIQHIEPVELTVAENDHVLRVRVLADLTAIFGGYSGSTEQPRVLVHAKRLTTHCIGRQLFLPHGTHK